MRSLLRHPDYYKNKFTFFFFTKQKNEWKECEFWRQKTQKSKFYKNKKAFKIYDIDINRILVSKEEPYGSNILNLIFHWI